VQSALACNQALGIQGMSAKSLLCLVLDKRREAMDISEYDKKGEKKRLRQQGSPGLHNWLAPAMAVPSNLLAASPAVNLSG